MPNGPTTSSMSGGREGVAAQQKITDELIMVCECDRPLSGSARHSLEGVEEAVIRRGPRRSARRVATRLEVSIPDPHCSAVHAVLRREPGGGWTILDNHSKNGTVVAGRAMKRRTLLADGDVIECGRTFFVLREGQRRPVEEPLDVDTESVVCMEGLMTFHEPLARQLRQLRAAAHASVPILISGPTGTGKELVARAVHVLSGRTGELVAINCGALAASVVEAELFGRARGAFTDANEGRPGLIRHSHQGTLFLDEVAELPLSVQPTLLRALAEGEVIPIGDTRPVRVDARIVSATHQDLRAMAEAGSFREDLLSRLRGLTIEMPALRERREDLGILLAALLRRHRGSAESVITIGSEAMRMMLSHPWPTNIRELEQLVRTGLALSPSRLDTPPKTRIAEHTNTRASRRTTPSDVQALELSMSEDELRRLLRVHDGDVAEVARRTGIAAYRLADWIRRFGL